MTAILTKSMKRDCRFTAPAYFNIGQRKAAWGIFLTGMHIVNFKRGNPICQDILTVNIVEIVIISMRIKCLTHPDGS